MPRLTSAADHSKLWFVIAPLLGAIGQPAGGSRRRPRRRDPRGHQPVHQPGRQARLATTTAQPVTVPLSRRSRRSPTSNSLPSGHSASAAAFAVGVGLESPPLGFGLALLAGLVGMSRVAAGAHYPWRRVGRVRHRRGHRGPRRADRATGRRAAAAPGRPTARRHSVRGRTAPGVLVINPASGSGNGARVVDEVRWPCRRPRSSNSTRRRRAAPYDGRRPRRGAGRRRRRRNGVVRGGGRVDLASRWRCSPAARSTTSPRTSAATPWPRPSRRSARAARRASTSCSSTKPTP